MSSVRKVGRPKGTRQYKTIVKMPTPSLDECYVRIFRAHASGRVPVSQHPLSAQLMIRFGIPRSQPSVSRDLQDMERRGIVVKTGVKKPYRLVQEWERAA